MTEIPEDAVEAAAAAMTKGDSPIVRTHFRSQAIMKAHATLEAAMPHIEAQLRREIAEDVLRAADSIPTLPGTFGDQRNQDFMIGWKGAANAVAARIAEGSGE